MRAYTLTLQLGLLLSIVTIASLVASNIKLRQMIDVTNRQMAELMDADDHLKRADDHLKQESDALLAMVNQYRAQGGR